MSLRALITIIGVLACGSATAPVGAETVVIDMPPPPSGYVEGISYTVSQPNGDSESDPIANAEYIDVGTVALTRFARVRHTPADTYWTPPMIFRSYGQVYYNWGYGYGYGYGYPGFGYGYGYGWPWGGWWGGGVRYNVHVRHVRPVVNRFRPMRGRRR